MNPYLPRRVTSLAACGLVAVSALAACGHTTSPASANGAASAASSPGATATTAAEELTPTKWGPLSATDQKLITIVRQTSLREITLSKWALQRSSNPKIKQAAQMIIKQHVVLNKKDLALGAKLGMKLPNKPAPDMQVGIDRMRTEKGKTFDTDYVNTLRQAHGVASILLATVRADTQNTLVRPFADFAANFIHNHMVMLEKTGVVNYGQLPVPTG